MVASSFFVDLLKRQLFVINCAFWQLTKKKFLVILRVIFLEDFTDNLFRSFADRLE